MSARWPLVTSAWRLCRRCWKCWVWSWAGRGLSWAVFPCLCRFAASRKPCQGSGRVSGQRSGQRTCPRRFFPRFWFSATVLFWLKCQADCCRSGKDARRRKSKSSSSLNGSFNLICTFFTFSNLTMTRKIKNSLTLGHFYAKQSHPIKTKKKVKRRIIRPKLNSALSAHSCRVVCDKRRATDGRWSCRGAKFKWHPDLGDLVNCQVSLSSRIFSADSPQDDSLVARNLKIAFGVTTGRVEEPTPLVAPRPMNFLGRLKRERLQYFRGLEAILVDNAKASQ